jgi:hypothetical protein
VRRKVLQDLANTLCQMLVGWRGAGDIWAIAALPDGMISIDLLARTARHSTAGELQLYLTGELAAWLDHRLGSLAIPKVQIRTATVEAAYRTDRIKTNRKKVVSIDWTVESLLATDEAQYLGRVVETHQWHSHAAT